MNTTTAVKAAGITYRQLDYWISKGYIKGGNPGSGNPRDLDDTEAAVLHLMVTFVNAGFLPARAAKAARQMLEGSA